MRPRSLSGAALLLTLLSLFVMALTGCRVLSGQNSVENDPAASTRAHFPRPSSLILNWPVEDKPGRLKPAGVGVVVCEPIAKATDAAQAAFGAGCTRWLQLAVGGQGELAQTPTWTTIDRARSEMKLADLRLGLDDTAGLAQRTGATQCVVSEVSGSARESTLTLAIADIAKKRLVGRPLTVTGSRDRIARQLPSLALLIANRLGAVTPFTPTLECTPEDLLFLGGLPWLPSRALPDSDKARLSVLASKSPLAALLALSCSDLRDTSRCDALAHDMVTAAPNSTAVFGGLAYLYWHGCVSEAKALDTLRARYPGNYQLAAAHIMRVRGTNPAEESAAAAALTQTAPRNPEAWLSAGYTLSSASEALRKGRYASQLSFSESASLDRIYADWLADVKKATELDPDFAHAWARLATAATFAGDSGLADRALWTALRLNPEEKDALEWGIQMYQPKWGGDPAKLLDVAHRAAEAWHWDSRVYGIAREIEAGGQPVEARRMRVEALRHERIAAKANPGDYTAQSEYAWGLKESSRYGEGETVFRNVLKRFPKESANNGSLHDGLGTCLVEQGKKREAIAEFLLAVRMNPQSTSFLRDLGYAYRQNVEPLKAVEIFKQADQIDGGNANAWGLLGDAYLDARKMNDAITAYQKAVDLDPRQAVCWRNLSVALGQTGRYAEGIEAAEKSLSMGTSDLEVHQSLAFLYGKTKQFQKSVDECRTVLQMNPNDALAHSNLGEALNDLHHRAEARREWETALQLDPNGENGKNARQMLSKNP